MIVILKMCNGRMDTVNTQEKSAVIERKQNFDDWFSRFVINPYSKYLLIWNMLMAVIYLVSIFMDTLIIGFHLHPLLDPSICNWNTSLSFLMLFDVFLKFFISYPATSINGEEEEDENLN